MTDSNLQFLNIRREEMARGRAHASHRALDRHCGTFGALELGTHDAWTGARVEEITMDMGEAEEEEMGVETVDLAKQAYERVLAEVNGSDTAIPKLSPEEKALYIRGWRQSLSQEEIARRMNFNIGIAEHCYSKQTINPARVSVSA